jgi:hypothetical protein
MAKNYIGYAERPLNGEVRVKIAYRENGVFGREEARGIDLDEIAAIENERAAARGTQR